MAKWHDDDEKVRALIDAAYEGDRVAAARHEVSIRTLQLWRKDLEKSPELTQIFAQKKAEKDRSWADDAPLAVKACMDFVVKAAQEGNHKNSDMVHAIAGAMKIVSEVMAVREYLDAKLNNPTA